jgi:hypothetical protein
MQPKFAFSGVLTLNGPALDEGGPCTPALQEIGW